MFLIVVVSYLSNKFVFFAIYLSSFCDIENLGCLLRITKGVSVWMIGMLDLIGTLLL